MHYRSTSGQRRSYSDDRDDDEEEEEEEEDDDEEDETSGFGLDSDCMYSRRRSTDAAAERRRRYASRDASYETTGQATTIGDDSFEGPSVTSSSTAAATNIAASAASALPSIRRRRLYHESTLANESIYTSTESAYHLPVPTQEGHTPAARVLTSTEEDADSISTAYYRGAAANLNNADSFYEEDNSRYYSDSMYRDEPNIPAQFRLTNDQDEYSDCTAYDRYNKRASLTRYDSADNRYDSPVNNYDSPTYHYDSPINHYDSPSTAIVNGPKYALYAEEYRDDSLEYTDCKQSRYSDDAAFQIEGVVARFDTANDYYSSDERSQPLSLAAYDNRPRLQDEVIQEEDSYHTDQDNTESKR